MPSYEGSTVDGMSRERKKVADDFGVHFFV